MSYELMSNGLMNKVMNGVETFFFRLRIMAPFHRRVGCPKVSYGGGEASKSFDFWLTEPE